MNKQGPNGIEWTHVYGPGTGFTWNVIGGCPHECQWRMPDGTVARCYAKDVALGIASLAYPQGFEHHYWHPERLEEPVRRQQPAGIFLDSMSDLLSRWVTDDQVNQVLDVARRAPQHTFQLLTKNPKRLTKFDFPKNVWVGVSAPPTFMNGRELTIHQQVQWYAHALEVLDCLHDNITWSSIEPLSWDVSELVARFYQALDWVVIGAASNGKQEFPPDKDHFMRLMLVLDEHDIPVFFKGNLRSLAVAAQDWREEFPHA